MIANSSPESRATLMRGPSGSCATPPAAGAQAGDESRSDLLEHRVSGAVAVRVVDFLEMIDVDVEQRNDAARERSVRDLGMDLLEEEPAIRQAGEAVVVCEPDQIPLVLVLLGDLADEQAAQAVPRPRRLLAVLPDLQEARRARLHPQPVAGGIGQTHLDDPRQAMRAIRRGPGHRRQDLGRGSMRLEDPAGSIQQEDAIARRLEGLVTRERHAPDAGAGSEQDARGDRRDQAEPKGCGARGIRSDHGAERGKGARHEGSEQPPRPVAGLASDAEQDRDQAGRGHRVGSDEQAPGRSEPRAVQRDLDGQAEELRRQAGQGAHQRRIGRAASGLGGPVEAWAGAGCRARRAAAAKSNSAATAIAVPSAAEEKSAVTRVHLDSLEAEPRQRDPGSV